MVDCQGERKWWTVREEVVDCQRERKWWTVRERGIVDYQGERK